MKLLIPASVEVMNWAQALLHWAARGCAASKHTAANKTTFGSNLNNNADNGMR
jgi:hypothetical protein